MHPDTRLPQTGAVAGPERAPVTGSALALPGEGLDLDAMPPLVRGRCNWCGGSLPRGRRKTCGKDCERAWDSAMRSLGRSLAERAIWWAQHRRESPMPKPARRAFSEMAQLARVFLRRLRDMQRGTDES